MKLFALATLVVLFVAEAADAGLFRRGSCGQRQGIFRSRGGCR